MLREALVKRLYRRRETIQEGDYQEATHCKNESVCSTPRCTPNTKVVCAWRHFGVLHTLSFLQLVHGRAK